MTSLHHRPIHFGWSFRTHTALEQAATTRLPESSLKTFLFKNMKAINEASIRQDKEQASSWHYLNIESLNPEGTPPLPIKPQHKKKFFRLLGLFADPAEKQREFRAVRWQPKELEKSPNVFQAVIKSYEELVSLLSRVGRDPIIPEREKSHLTRRLIESLGKLSHFATDAGQPFHATIYDWDQNHPTSQKNAHFYMEVDMLPPEAFAKMGEKIARTPHDVRFIPKRRLGERVIAQLQKGYLKIYDLVRTDYQARMQSKTDPDSYPEKLRRAWEPIAEDRIRASADLLTDLLYSAARAAGFPDLGKLKPAPEKTGPAFNIQWKPGPCDSPNRTGYPL